MSISNNDLFKLVSILPEETKQSAYDFLRFLAIGHPRPDWDEIMKMKPDDIPLSAEEEKQLKSAEFVNWEEAMHELNLPADIKP